MTPVQLNTFQGHIVLYCKSHYKCEDFFEGLKMIWAIRCGYDYDQTSNDTLVYVANDMYKIINACEPKRLINYSDNFFREINNQSFWKPVNMSPIQAIIWEFRIIISNMQVREEKDGKYFDLIKLPKLQRRIFNRILRGNGKYDDYELIVNADKS